jgi:hypothetical protein
MYDFFFGAHQEVTARYEDYLLFIKHLLPRWLNSIPDAEFSAILADAALADAAAGGAPIYVETGVGASTIALAGAAYRNGGRLYSWDANPSKGSAIRQILSETLDRISTRRIDDVWCFIPGNSLSPSLGLPVLQEIGARVAFCFFDSEHTKRTLIGEVEAVQPTLADGAVLAIDDATYTYVHTNEALVNMQRQKLGLPRLDPIPGNAGRPFAVEVTSYLQDRWTTVTGVGRSFGTAVHDDLYWRYYAADRAAMHSVGMENLDQMEDRYAAWQVHGRRGPQGARAAGGDHDA